MTRRDFVRRLAAGGIAPAWGVLRGAGIASSRVAITGIDTHAHVYENVERSAIPATMPAVARPEEYRRRLNESGISHAVLVQPTFYGVDNRYLTAAIGRDPDRLRGIGMVDPAISDGGLDALDRAGVTGVRLVSARMPDWRTAAARALLGKMAERSWVADVLLDAGELPLNLPPLLASGVNIVVEHFGRLDPRQGIGDPGFRYLLSLAPTGRVWVKLSGSWIWRTGPNGAAAARQAAPLLAGAFGPRRLLWGSDWPGTSPARALAALAEWIPDPSDRQVILRETPARLYRF